LAQGNHTRKHRQYQLIREFVPDNQWLPTPLRGLGNAELSGTRLHHLVDAPLRYAATRRWSRKIATIIRAQALHYRGNFPLSSAIRCKKITYQIDKRNLPGYNYKHDQIFQA